MIRLKKILSITIFFLFIIGTESLLAMGPPPGPPGGGGGPPCWPPPCAAIPLDGGIGLILAAGIAYGGKKIFDNNKKNPG